MPVCFVKIILFRDICTLYEFSFYGVFWEHVLLIWGVGVIEIAF